MTSVEEPGEATTTGKQENQEAVRSATPQHFPEISSPHEPQNQEGNENERLLLFSDGIIAFAITLATISIRLPSDKPVAELPTLLAELFPKLLTYLIGFVIVVAMLVAFNSVAHRDKSEPDRQHAIAKVKH
jgi:hypothetical protein